MIALQQQAQPIVNNKALAWTIGSHALLLFVFFLFRYTVDATPVIPDLGGGGMEVNLGTSDKGSGNDQPQSTKAPAPYEATVVMKSTAAPSSIPKNIATSDAEDAPPVSNNSKRTGTAAANEKGHVQAKPKYTYAGETGTGGNKSTEDKRGSNEGNDPTGNGDKGVPGGTPGAPNYTGTPGKGTGGIGHNLGGRSITPDRFEAEFSESGKVVIRVTVDRSGAIISKSVKSSPNATLSKLALQKLADARFSKSDGPEPQQFGDVTIYFTTRK